MSNIRETSWEDIGEVCLFFVAGLPSAAYKSVKMSLVRHAEAQTDKPAQAWWRRPLAAAAVAARDLQQKLADIDIIGMGFFAGAHLAAFTTGIWAATTTVSALHATWAGLLTGQGILSGLGIVGAGLAAYAVAGAACFVGLGIALPALAGVIGGAGKIVAAARLGRKETSDWRLEQAAPKPVVAPAPVAYVPPAPPRLISDLGQKMDMLEKASAEERVQFLKKLRRKFPADFADAVRSDLHAPQLRKDISAMKTLKFKRKGMFKRVTGGAP